MAENLIFNVKNNFSNFSTIYNYKAYIPPKSVMGGTKKVHEPLETIILSIARIRKLNKF